MQHVIKESLTEVFRRHRALLIISVLLFYLVFGARTTLMALNRTREPLSPDLEATMPEIPMQPEMLGANKLGSILQVTEQVGPEYLLDTVFLGDSLTDGLGIYDVFDGARPISTMGISPITATTHRFYRINGQGAPLTMVEAVERLQPRKVYIMLGTNSIDGGSIEWNLAGYAVLLDALAQRAPDTLIIIQSIPPTRPFVAARRPAFSRENLGRYNAGLVDLAINRGLYFLDVNAALSDEEGYLRSDIAAKDGIHLTINGYRIWHQCVMTHALLGDLEYGLDHDGRITYDRPPDLPEESPEEERSVSGPCRGFI